MDQALNGYQVVVVDDDTGFSSLISHVLHSHGYRILCFERGQEAIEWLGKNEADLMLLDYSLDDMTGRDVVEQLDRCRRRLPFIMVTGDGNERLAAEMVKFGAEDYLVKNQELIDLLPLALEQTLELVKQRKTLELAQKNYHKYESLYRELFNSAADAWLMVDDQGVIMEINQKVSDIFGYAPQQLLGASLEKLCPKETRAIMSEIVNYVRQGQSIVKETLGAKQDGTILDLEIKGNQIASLEKPAAMFIIRDISERKWAEEELKLTNQQLRVSEQAVRERERRLRAIFQGSAVGIVLYDLEGKAIESNHFFQRLTGYSNIELRAIPFQDYLHPEDRSSSQTIFSDLKQGKCSCYQIEERYISRMGIVCWVRVTASIMKGDGGQSDYIIHVIEDISERKQAEESLRRNEKKYRLLFENMLDGFAYYQIIFSSKQEPIDYICLEINGAFERLTSLKREDVIGKKQSEMTAANLDDTFDWKDLCSMLARTGEVHRVEKYSEKMNRWFLISAYSPVKGHFATIIEDITYRRQIEEELRDFTSELETSNRDLENFTRLLTGDLQHQLEAIDKGLECFKDRYTDCLQKEAQAELKQISSQSRRIKRVLGDVMVCSRLSYHGSPFEAVDLKHLVQQILERYRTLLEDVDANIALHDLPIVYGDRQQLWQMFEKLLDNAIDYRSERELVVEISCQNGESMWEICFKDNGCGIDYEQQARVFDLFYSVNNPEGTGVGLSVVKKIVERHGGNIRLQSHPDQGTALYLSFPK